MPTSQVIVDGSASLSLMHDTILFGLMYGMPSHEPWCLNKLVKFICPVPGYDRHFSICEALGIQMIKCTVDR